VLCSRSVSRQGIISPDPCAAGYCIEVRSFVSAPAMGIIFSCAEGSMPHGGDALAARFTRAWSAKCGRVPYPDLFETMGCASSHLLRDLSFRISRKRLSNNNRY
jgi:hypothetical protein